jgi:hypothetical protein
MSFLKLQFRPGINREITSYADEGGWFDGDKIRFRMGYPESIGGWETVSPFQFLGTCRALHTWTALDNTNYIGVGTNLKYYVLRGSDFFDITPLRLTTSAGDVTFAATDGSSTIEVTDTAHGALLNDFVTFSGAASLGGNVTALILNAEHQITSIIDGNTYTIAVSVTANASDSGSGGASVVGAYQINTGLDNFCAWHRLGRGYLGRGRLGLSVWHSHSRRTAAPLVARQLRRGCDDEFSPGVEDPLLIRFCAQENIADWETRVDNTAGSLRISVRAARSPRPSKPSSRCWCSPTSRYTRCSLWGLRLPLA